MSNTCLVTATITDPSQSPLLGNAYVKFRLRNFTGFVPTVSGGEVICEDSIDAYPNPAGVISQVLVCNTAISPVNTFYAVEFWNQGRPVSSANYFFNQNTDLSSAQEINPPPPPPYYAAPAVVTLYPPILPATLYWDQGAGAFGFTGANTNALNKVGSLTNIWPTTIDNGAVYLYSAASASLNTVIGIDQGTGGSYGSYGFQSFSQWVYRCAVTQTTSARYYMGLACWNNGGTGTDGTAILSTTRYATNTPNCTTLGFRYSAGTDTTWKAVAITSASVTATASVVDTGVPIDRLIHTFGMQTTGTTVSYFIDGLLTATITGGGVPPTSLTSNGLAAQFCTGDNQDTNTAVGYDFYYMQTTLK